MNNRIAGAATWILALGFAGPVAAGPFEDGIGLYQAGDYANALSIWRPMANGGYAPAQNNLGMMYALGQDLPHDDAMAMKWYARAADQGYAAAQLNLGDQYANGQGAPRDYGKAAAWYRKAAAQGYSAAQDRLGELYAAGHGVEQDPVRALMWFDLAATHHPRTDYEGRAEAAKRRDAFAARLTSAQVAEAQNLARAWTPGAVTP